MLLAALLIAQLDVAPEHHLNRARVCMGTLDFDCAERALAAVRSQLDRIEPSLALEALALSTEAALSTGRYDAAEEHLVELLTRSPRFAPKPGSWPPRWLEVLAGARKRVPDQSPPVVQVKSTAKSAPPGVEIAVRATIEDPSGVGRAVLELIDPPLEIAMTSTGTMFLGVIPAERARPPGVRFAVAAFDAYGNGPARSELRFVEVNDPVIAASPAPPEPSITEQWWFWTLLGAVVVGGAAAAVALSVGGEQGAVTARLEWP